MKKPLYLSSQSRPGQTIYDLRPDNPNPVISCPTARELEEAGEKIRKYGYHPYRNQKSKLI